MTDGPHAYDRMDERVGLWTIVDEERDRVVVRLSETYRRGRVIGLLFAVVVGGGFVKGALQPEQSALAVGVSVIAVMMVIGLIRSILRTRRNGSGGPVLIIHDKTEGPDGSMIENELSASQIKAVEVRENKGRQVSDMAMWQTYLHLHSDVRAILIHQRPKWRYEIEVGLAQRLADRWGVPLIR